MNSTNSCIRIRSSGNITYTNDDDSVSRTFYTSISSAITAAAASTNSATYTAYIYIQPGTYSLSSTITIPDYLTSTDNSGSFFNFKIFGYGYAGDVILYFNTSDDWSNGTTGFESDDNQLVLSPGDIVSLETIKKLAEVFKIQKYITYLTI